MPSDREAGWRLGLPSDLAMTRELLFCLRIVHYGLMGPAAAEPLRPVPLREAV